MPPTFIPMEGPIPPTPEMGVEELGPATSKRARLRQEVSARGKKGSFKKFQQVLKRAGREGNFKSALRLGSAGLDAATFKSLSGAGRVGLLRGLGGLGALATLGYLGGSTAYDVLADPYKRKWEADRLAGEDQNASYELGNRASNAAQILEAERLKQAIQQNLAEVAQNSPALYNQVSAGRRLPRGAVVLGGQPRQDLLMELARAMDSNAFQKQDPLSDLMG